MKRLKTVWRIQRSDGYDSQFCDFEELTFDTLRAALRRAVQEANGMNEDIWVLSEALLVAGQVRAGRHIVVTPGGCAHEVMGSRGRKAVRLSSTGARKRGR